MPTKRMRVFCQSGNFINTQTRSHTFGLRLKIWMSAVLGRYHLVVSLLRCPHFVTNETLSLPDNSRGPHAECNLHVCTQKVNPFPQYDAACVLLWTEQPPGLGLSATTLYICLQSWFHLLLSTAV